jgi:TrmH family RNA methyltransferase
MSSPSDLERLVVVLVSNRNPLNIGAAARAMSNFGFSRLRVVNPYEVAFREAKSAVGATAILKAAEEFSSIAEAVADCTLVVGTTAAHNRELQQPLNALPDGARLIRRRLQSRRVALLFGSEKRGLSNDDLSHCHWLMRIPTREDRGSMNLGQAVAVCLYELARPSRLKPSLESDLAPARQLEALTQRLLEALTVSGYVKPRSSASTEEKIRRMVHRLRLPASDAELWMGVLRQILWKLRQSSH